MSNDSNDKRPAIEILPDVHPGMPKEELDRICARLTEGVRDGRAVVLGGDFIDGFPFGLLDPPGSMRHPDEDTVAQHEVGHFVPEGFFKLPEGGGTMFDSAAFERLLADLRGDSKFDKYRFVITDGEPSIKPEDLEAAMQRLGVDPHQTQFVGDNPMDPSLIRQRRFGDK